MPVFEDVAAEHPLLGGGVAKWLVSVFAGRYDHSAKALPPYDPTFVGPPDCRDSTHKRFKGDYPCTLSSGAEGYDRCYEFVTTHSKPVWVQFGDGRWHWACDESEKVVTGEECTGCQAHDHSHGPTIPA